MDSLLRTLAASVAGFFGMVGAHSSEWPPGNSTSFVRHVALRRISIPCSAHLGAHILVQANLMAITTVIVDDERPARDELAFLLKGFPELEVIAQGKNGLEALTLIKEHNPDLVFLDVQMPGLDGFGVIKKLF